MAITAYPQEVSADVLLSQSFDSHALGKPLKYSMYLPPEYDVESGTRYAAIYLLPGLGDTETTWVKRGKVETTLDNLIERGEIPPVLVVMPDTNSSWVVDSADVRGPGNYATALRDDLIAHVDANFRTIAERYGRAIAGVSMGGFGALRLAFETPERYAATAGLSAALWMFMDENYEMPADEEKLFKGSFGTPFSYQRFKRQRPDAFLVNVKNHDERLGVYLTVGDDDPWEVPCVFDLFSLMKERKVPVEFRITNGGHSWKLWAVTLSDVLRFFAREFVRHKNVDE